MMGNSLLECCVFGRRAGRGRRREARGVMAVATDLQKVVEDAAAHLYVWALKDIPQDLRDALADAAAPRDLDPRPARARHDPQERRGGRGRRRTSSARTPASPSTTAASASTSRSTRRGSTRRCYDGTERATVEHPLRSNTVHTLTRENTGQNVGYRVPIVHWDFVPDWDGLDVKCVPKGSGSENMSFLKMCVPADGVAGDQAVRARVDRRRRRQAVPARDRRRRHRRLGRLRDAPRQGGDRPAGRHAQPRPAGREARGRALRSSSTRPGSARWASAATSPSSSATSSTRTRT